MRPIGPTDDFHFPFLEDFSMKMLRCLLLLAALPLATAAPSQADAAHYSVRQYYSGWHKHPKANYHYRHYYYKPSSSYAGYRHHYVIYTPQRPKYYYYYNPYKKAYWGRCPVETAGQGQYSLLAEKDRRGDLKEIPESAFPAPAALPAIPDSTDGEALDLPPDDLPPDSSLPAISD
jgi:hypothetical protein